MSSADLEVLLLPATRRDGEVTSGLLGKAGLSCRVCTMATLVSALERPIGAIVMTDAALGDSQIDTVVAALRAQPTWSDIPVILLSTPDAPSTAPFAVHAFFTNLTLLDRPTSIRTLISTILAAIRGRERQYLIRDQLESLRRAETTVRESAEQLALAVQVAGLAVAEVDYSKQQYELTAEAAAMFGLGQEPMVVPCAAVLEVVHPDDRIAFERHAPREFASNGASIHTREYRVVRAGEDMRWLSERRRVYFDSTGTQPVRALLIALDITELRRAERRKDEFLATLAHELRNPLAPVRIGLHLLGQPGLDPSLGERTREMMERQIGQLTHLIDDLLDVSRISTGKVILRRQPLQLRLVIEGAIEACRPMIDAGEHRLTFTAEKGEVWANGDMARLSQVVSNLITNAAKYTPQGGRIDVRLTRENADAVVSVTDNGVGIPAHMTERVFEMFAQVNQTLDRAQGGLGIGLALVRTLMELHGGAVTASSAGLGHGSTFTVRLPALTTPPQATGSQDRGAVAQSAGEMRVLIIDDNRDSADSLAMLLDLEGHETRTEYTAATGLDAARSFDPDIVFCDIGLPTMNGYDVARGIRLQREATHVPYLVAVTGWGTQEDKTRAREAGFDFHLTKPVAAEAIQGVLAKVAR